MINAGRNPSCGGMAIIAGIGTLYMSLGLASCSRAMTIITGSSALYMGLCFASSIGAVVTGITGSSDS